MPSAILAVLLAFFAGSAGAESVSRRGQSSSRAQSELLYQKGLERYAAGRFAEALLAFQEALRRDPGSRAARTAVTRVRGEMAMMAAAESSVARPKPSDEATILDTIIRFVEFEDTVGDAREVAGRAEAMMGRIAQLLAEKKIARAHHRRFAKDRELRALSRRLA